MTQNRVFRSTVSTVRISRREVCQLDASGEEEGAAADEESVRPLIRKGREGSIDFGAGVGIDDPDLQSHGARRRFHVPRVGYIFTALLLAVQRARILHKLAKKACTADRWTP